MIDQLTSIVAIDRRGAIGCKNRLPWAIKTDLAFFKKTTLGNSVIMGRKTYESIGGCLPGRKNLVLSHNSVLFPSTDECRLVLSVDEALAKAMSDKTPQSFVVGGAATYAEFADLVDRYVVTLVDHEVPEADAFLDNGLIAEIEGWPSELVGAFDAVPGRDDHPFKIVSFTAPDAAERRSTRLARAERFLSNRLNASTKASRNRFTRKFDQEAFVF